MARLLRIEYPNAWYHVMNRGRRGDNIFSDKTDFENFLDVLQESSEMFGCRVAAHSRTTKDLTHLFICYMTHLL